MAQSYPGISKKKLKNGTECIMVRFKLYGKIYPIKNFTNLYGITELDEANEKLSAIKLDIKKGHDPFNVKGVTLNEHYNHRKAKMRKENKWRDSTIKNYDTFYDNHIKKNIGHLKLDKIDYKDLTNITDNMTNSSAVHKNTLYRILNPIFNEAIKHKEITENPASHLVLEKNKQRESLTTRVREDNLKIIVKLYKAIMEYNAKKPLHIQNEIREYFKFLLLTGHRYGEVILLRKENIYLDTNEILAPKHTTKTNEEYKYPIPPDSLAYIKSIESGLIFPNMNYDTVRGMFERIVYGYNKYAKKPDKRNIQANEKYNYKTHNYNKGAGIKMYNNKTISTHDIRSIMLNTMVKDCKIDATLADFCLEHKQSGVIKHYLHYSYKDKVKAFKKYWKTISKAINKSYKKDIKKNADKEIKLKKMEI